MQEFEALEDQRARGGGRQHREPRLAATPTYKANKFASPHSNPPSECGGVAVQTRHLKDVRESALHEWSAITDTAAYRMWQW
jgi:hypothetical protein